MPHMLDETDSMDNKEFEVFVNSRTVTKFRVENLSKTEHSQGNRESKSKQPISIDGGDNKPIDGAADNGYGGDDNIEEHASI
jgi:hypothetical protein